MAETPDAEDFKGIIVFISSVSSSLELKKHQQRISMVLTSKKIPHECYDIATNNAYKEKMREICGATSVPPQIMNDEKYCGDFGAFNESLECETLNEFLKL